MHGAYGVSLHGPNSFLTELLSDLTGPAESCISTLQFIEMIQISEQSCEPIASLRGEGLLPGCKTFQALQALSWNKA